MSSSSSLPLPFPLPLFVVVVFFVPLLCDKGNQSTPIPSVLCTFDELEHSFPTPGKLEQQLPRVGNFSREEWVNWLGDGGVVVQINYLLPLTDLLPPFSF